MAKSYSEKLRSPKWQKRRLEIMQRDDFTCQLCGDKETTLNVHHLKYTGEPWEAPAEDLTTNCEDCHMMVEDLKNIGWSIFSIIKKIDLKYRIKDFVISFKGNDCLLHAVLDFSNKLIFTEGIHPGHIEKMSQMSLNAKEHGRK